MKKITLVFNSSESAEIAYEEYFAAESDAFIAKLDRKEASIKIKQTIGAVHLEAPNGLIAIII